MLTETEPILSDNNLVVAIRSEAIVCEGTSEKLAGGRQPSGVFFSSTIHSQLKNC
jgi:hypothetical protein